jgi:cobalt-zinc-cadmium efflux system membrane fusion protein
MGMSRRREIILGAVPTMLFHMRTTRLTAALAAGAVLVAAGACVGFFFADGLRQDLAATSANAAAEKTDPSAPTVTSPGTGDPATAKSVTISETQLASVKVEPAGERLFPVEKDAVGSIDFNEEMSVQVFTNYQGRIIELFAKVGDEVTKGQRLFTIDSPDLIQAESTLISAAGVLNLTTRALNRARGLYESRAIAQKDLEQATAEQQTAEGALRAARDSVRLFGKSEAEIDRIIAERHLDPVLVIASPIAGRVTARNAAPGLFVQPGNPPAPYTVTDISTMWMIANVAETDIPALKVGQQVTVKIKAFPDRVFDGRISTISQMVDPNTHRALVRSEVADPGHELRSGMFATFVIRTGDPVRSVAVALNGVVREGDGTMTVWVTTDRRHFVRRTVKIGMQREGYHQVLEGLQAGELVATDGALFLSNALTTASR